MHFMIGLRDDLKYIRASLLSCSLAPFDVEVKELIFKENRWPTNQISSFDHILATPSPPSQYLIIAFTAFL